MASTGPSVSAMSTWKDNKAIKNFVFGEEITLKNCQINISYENTPRIKKWKKKDKHSWDSNLEPLVC